MESDKLIYNHKRWLNEVNPEVLRLMVDRFLSQSQYTVLDFTEHRFQPQGYTALWLLAESHLAVHTFPENFTTYLELSGCNEAMNQRFLQALDAWIGETPDK